MKHIKKILVLCLSMFILTTSCLKAFALEDEFKRTINLDYLKNTRYDFFKRKQTRKGFKFGLKFYRNKEDFTINFADIIVRHLKKISKKTFNLDDEYINQIFQNYKINYDEDYFYINFYVFPKEEDYEQILKFCRKYLLEEKFYNLFSRCYINKKEFEYYVEDYFYVIDRKLRIFAKNVVDLYAKEDFEEIYEMFLILVRDCAHSDDVFSALTQYKRIKPVMQNIVKLLKKIVDDDLENKEDMNIYYYEKYDDYLQITDNFADENFNKKLYSINFNETEIFRYLIYNIRRFFRLCCLNIKNLKKINFENFKHSLKNSCFGDEIKIVKEN